MCRSFPHEMRRTGSMGHFGTKKCVKKKKKHLDPESTDYLLTLDTIRPKMLRMLLKNKIKLLKVQQTSLCELPYYTTIKKYYLLLFLILLVILRLPVNQWRVTVLTRWQSQFLLELVAQTVYTTCDTTSLSSDSDCDVSWACSGFSSLA